MPAVATLPVGARAAAAARADLQLQGLQRCLQHLLQNGIRVVSYHGDERLGRDRVVVTVVASPLLHRLYADRCAPFRRRQEGALTLFTWLAVDLDNDVRIEWEEVECGA